MRLPGGAPCGVGLLLCGLLVCARPVAAAEDQPPASVSVAVVTQRDMPVDRTGLGVVEAFNAVTVRPRISGQIARVAFREGQKVAAGDLLVEIDPRPFEIALAQAQGQLERDQALLEEAEIDLKRYRTLIAQASLARQQLDTQQSLVHQYQGTIRADQAMVDNAHLNLSYCHVLAPIGGRAGLRQIDQGNLIQTTDITGLVIVSQLQPVSVIFTLPEDLLPDIQEAMERGPLAVTAFNRDGSRQLSTGTLAVIDNQINPANATLKLKAVFPNEREALWPGQFIRARLRLAMQKAVAVVPVAAVQQGAAGPFVYVVRSDDTVEARPFQAGETGAGVMIAKSGLRPGETIVTEGQFKLAPGMKVRPTPDTARKGS